MDSKYKPEYCEQLLNHMAEGFSFEAFGSEVGVGKTTLYNGCMAHAEFRQAKEVGSEASRKKIEAMLMECTRTGKGNVVGAIFMLKNRFPNEWRDKRELEVKKEDDSKQLTLDEQLEKVELMRSQLLQLKAGQEQQDIKTIEAGG